jgi:hypothetical protein
VVTGGDLCAVEGHGGSADLTMVNPRAEDGQSEEAVARWLIVATGGFS